MSSLRDALGVQLTQVPITFATFVSHIMPLAVSYFAMAKLALTPGETRVYRIALWPIVTLLTLRAAFVDYSHGKQELIFINGELIRFLVCIPTHTLSWTLAKKPLVRYRRPANSPQSIIMDALDLATNIRGIGWDWSRGLYIPQETRPTNRIAFALYALLSTITKTMSSAAMLQAIHTFTAGSKTQPTIFDETLPLFARCLKTSIITFISGVMAYNGVQAAYHLFTVFGVLLFGQDPAQWPPGLEYPWFATSLTEFWGRRWQQWFRHTFLVCAHPFSIVFGRPGKVIGAFLASGLVHHLILIPYDRHSEMWRMFVGFGMMAPGMMAERAFYKATGRKVGGVVGWVWMVTWLLMWYSFVVDGFVRAKMYSLPSDSQAWGWVENSVKSFDTWLHSL